MGQQHNSGRNASLDDKKQRAAGRQGEHPGPARGETEETDGLGGDAGGAFGDAKTGGADEAGTRAGQGAQGKSSEK